MHVGIAFHRHQFVHLDAAGITNATQIVALQVDQHDVLGALLGMRDQLAHARRVVVPGKARTRARDRTRLRDAIAHLDQAFGRGTRDRPVISSVAIATVRRTARDSPCAGWHHACRRRRLRATQAPFARQVDLIGIAGAQMIVDARDPVEEPLRIILFDMRGSDRCGRKCRRRLQIARELIEQVGATRFGDQMRGLRNSIDDDGCRTTQCERDGNPRIRRRRQTQAGFDLRGQLVTEEQRPAAAEMANPRDSSCVPRETPHPARRENPLRDRSRPHRARGHRHAAPARPAGTQTGYRSATRAEVTALSSRHG